MVVRKEALCQERLGGFFSYRASGRRFLNESFWKGPEEGRLSGRSGGATCALRPSAPWLTTIVLAEDDSNDFQPGLRHKPIVNDTVAVLCISMLPKHQFLNNLFRIRWGREWVMLISSLPCSA